MQADDIYAVVSSRLQDMTAVRRWPWDSPNTDHELSLERFINKGLLTIALQRPDATAEVKDFTLVQDLKQELAGTDLALIDCYFFMDEHGAIQNAVTRIERKDLDAYSPYWVTKEGNVYHWVYDRLQNPRSFFVIPKPDKADQQLKALVSKVPTYVTSPATILSISDLYAPALIELVLYQVFASDTDDANWQKAMGCMQVAAEIMGIKLETDITQPMKSMHDRG